MSEEEIGPDDVHPALTHLLPVDKEERKRLMEREFEREEERRRKQEEERKRREEEKEAAERRRREQAERERKREEFEAEQRERKQQALREGPATRIEEEAGLGNLENLSPERAAERLHEARDLVSDLDPEGQDVAYDYLQARATAALRSAWGDWGAVGDFVRAHFPPLQAGVAPYGADGFLKSVDIEDADFNVPTLVPGMVPSAAAGMLTSPYGMGKTFQAISLGLGVAFGMEWIGLDVEEMGPVRFIVAEGKAKFPLRLAGWLVHHGHLPQSFTRRELADVLDGRAEVTEGVLRLDDPNLERVLIRTLNEEGTRLLVLDTLGRLLGDEQSESDNDTANKVMGRLSNVAYETGATILLIHHPGHSGDRSRGASAWEQAADFAFRIKGSREEAKSGQALKLETAKQKDLPYGEDVGFRLRTVGFECDGEREETAVIEPSEIPEETPLPDLIRNVVRNHPGQSLRFIRDNVPGRNKEIGTAINQLIAAGKLEDKGKGSAYALYDVPGEWPTFDADVSELDGLPEDEDGDPDGE